MDTPDPKDDKCIIHISSLRIVRAIVKLINVEKQEWYSIMGKNVRHQNLSFGENMMEKGPYSEIKTQRNTIREQLSAYITS